MYNEFDHRDEDIYGTEPEPMLNDTENITQEELHAEEINAAEENMEPEASDEQESSIFNSETYRESAYDDTESDPAPAPAEEPSSSFYHYTYERGGENTHYTSSNSYQDSDPYAEPDHYPQPEEAKKPMNGTLKKFIVCAGMAAVFGLVGGTVFQLTNFVGSKVAVSDEPEQKIESAGTVNNSADELETENDGDLVSVNAAGTNITSVAKNVMPSIVALTTVGVQEVQSMFFGSTSQEYESSGSGIIVDQNDEELLIATNNHVVEGVETVSVCFTVESENPEDAVVEAQVKGTDPAHDLAVIAIKLSDIPNDIKKEIKVAQMGDSDKLEVGEQAVAIGNALGYGQSVTVGYISALDREVTVDNVTNNLIQTDAAINPGNSGGALLDIKGQVVGINSVKAAATGVEGMGYAIPINTAKPILDDLMNRTTRTKVETNEMGYLGVSVADVSDEAREIYEMPAGAYIKSVEEGVAAEKAGIMKGDIITKLDGITISSRAELLNRMQYYKAGEEIEVVVQRLNGEGEYGENTVKVTLDKRPADAGTAVQEQETEAQQQPPRGDQYQNPYEGYDEQNPFGDYDDAFGQFFGR